MASERQYLKDYKAPEFAIDSVELDFDLGETHCLVQSRLQMRRLENQAVLRLDGEKLNLVSVRLNGRELKTTEYEKTDSHLILQETPESFLLEIQTQLEPHKNTSLEGLYKSGSIFCTQCEAQGFRHITYFLDRPDVMSRYEVRLRADKKKYPVLLSNGDRLGQKDLGDGRHEIHWRDPHKKPCYLFALVAGDLGVLRDEFVTRSGRRVNLEIWAAHGLQDRCHHAMESLKKSMRWDEDAFGREYDLNDYMIVAIDDFNAGAMENKGLNIFNSRLVLADADSATDADFGAIESVVAHEYFHNWTGNRVTLRDWFHLSLKEGLTVFRDQEFSSDMTDRGVQRIKDVDSLRELQFLEDNGPNAHPVRPDSCLAVDNFFTMTIYEKGAELIRMMQTTVGRRGFRKGMDLYFERHDGQAVTTDDFAAAIAEPNGADFSQLKRWYSQAGTPRLHVEEQWNPQQGLLSLKIRQSTPPTPGQPNKEPFQIPIRLGLLDETGRDLPLQNPKIRFNSDELPLWELQQTEETLSFGPFPQKPVVSLLREFSAPVIVEWDRPDHELYFLMAHDSDSFARREAAVEAGLRVLSRLSARVLRGEKLVVEQDYLKAWSMALQADLDPAMKALLLELPSNEMLSTYTGRLDVTAWAQAREKLEHSLAVANQDRLLQIYQRWHGQDADQFDSKTAGHRSLKNLALKMLSTLKSAPILELVQKQDQEARNMTDRIAALMILSDWDERVAHHALDRFYQDWKGEALVLNKWFAVQARSERPGLRARVEKLTQHPDFQFTNPNNVYSLLRVYGGNLVAFHDPREPGYDFMAEMILKIDSMNAQVAARLTKAFESIGKLDSERQNLAKNAVRRILSSSTLSKNTKELLERLV